MTIPFIIMVVSLIVWLLTAKVPQISDGWVMDVARILFIISASVVIYGLANKLAF